MHPLVALHPLILSNQFGCIHILFFYPLVISLCKSFPSYFVSCWEGPYRIVKVQQVDLEIKSINPKDIQTVHVSRVKPAYIREEWKEEKTDADQYEIE